MIKLDIINRVAEKTGVPKMKAEQAVDALFHSMKEALTRGERIELRGFGVFVVKPRKRGVGRNPRDRKSTRLNSSHDQISYAVFCLKKKINRPRLPSTRF